MENQMHARRTSIVFRARIWSVNIAMETKQNLFVMRSSRSSAHKMEVLTLYNRYCKYVTCHIIIMNVDNSLTTCIYMYMCVYCIYLQLEIHNRKNELKFNCE